MTAFLLDTHIWFWYLVGAGRLPSGLRRELDRSVQACWLSPISVWELGMLHTGGGVGVADIRERQLIDDV